MSRGGYGPGPNPFSYGRGGFPAPYTHERPPQLQQPGGQGGQNPYQGRGGGGDQNGP